MLRILPTSGLDGTGLSRFTLSPAYCLRKIISNVKLVSLTSSKGHLHEQACKNPRISEICVWLSGRPQVHGGASLFCRLWVQNCLGFGVHWYQAMESHTQDYPAATGPGLVVILSWFSLYLLRKGLAKSQHLDSLIFIIIMLFRKVMYKKIVELRGSELSGFETLSLWATLTELVTFSVCISSTALWYRLTVNM